ncbi:MAG: hypothetical protein ACR2OV_14400 [Hyphomicrobiaceae bacterium]
MPITRLTVPGEMESASRYCHVVRAGEHVWLSGMVGMAADDDAPLAVWLEYLSGGT